MNTGEHYQNAISNAAAEALFAFYDFAQRVADAKSDGVLDLKALVEERACGWLDPMAEYTSPALMKLARDVISGRFTEFL